MQTKRPASAPAQDCAGQCRALAEETYRLADRTELPEVIADYLAAASKLLNCAMAHEATSAEPEGA
jgi:hypothetical protein